MRQIELSQGEVALVDDADYEHLSGYKWFYRGERGGKQGYAVRHGKKTDTKKTIYLHREVLREEVSPGHEVIFLNYDRLDCRKENLRVATKEEARQHHRVRCDNQQGAKGIRYDGETDTWTAYRYRSGHAYPVGSFGSKEQAEWAYREALKRENPSLHSAPSLVERRREPVEDAAA